MDGSIAGHLLLQLVLILLNAFFAATEIAVISLNETKLRAKAREGDKKSSRLLKMVTEPASFLSAIQIGITLAGFLGSAFAADSFSDRLAAWLRDDCGWTSVAPATLDTLCVIAITLILSYFTLVFGELVPKRIAMKKSERLAMRAGGFITGLSLVLKPVIWFLSASTNGVLRLLGINPKNDEETVSEDDIMLMVDLGEEKGTIESGQADMIENVFGLSDVTAGDVMVHRRDMEYIALDDSEDEIFKLITETGFSRFPVCGEDADDVRGILLTKKYLLSARGGSPRPPEELMMPALFVPETVPAETLLRDMQREKNHMAIVVDEYGGTSGLVTMEDLLERIVGSIHDETEPENPEKIVPCGEDSWRAEGDVSVADFGEATGMELDASDEEYDTLGGILISRLAKIPEDGSHPETDWCGLHLRAEKVAGRRVEQVLVTKLPQEEPKGEDTEE